MTHFRRIDWLRKLYREATKWSCGFQRQVQWAQLEVADPSNGSKPTLAQLENSVRVLLCTCVDNDQVPSEYMPEVTAFLAGDNHSKNIGNKFIEDMVNRRKLATSLYELSESLLSINDHEKDLIIGKIPTETYGKMCTVVPEIVARTASGEGDVSNNEKKQFKLDDWLRHMYINCQKWISNNPGRLSWKSMAVAKDPNNNKKVSRMKCDDLKRELMSLAPPCIQGNVVPKPYEEEVEEIARIAREGGRFNAEELEKKENLRLIAVKLIEVTSSIEDHIEEVLKILEPSKTLKIHAAMEPLENLFFKERQNVPDKALNIEFEKLFECATGRDVLDPAGTPAPGVESDDMEALSDVGSPAFSCSADSGISSLMKTPDPDLGLEDTDSDNPLDLDDSGLEELEDILKDDNFDFSELVNQIEWRFTSDEPRHLKRKLPFEFDKPRKRPRP